MNEFDYQQINEIIHSRIRLAIMAVLISVGEADFNFLKDKVNTTDGNLSIHLKKLEEAGYLRVKKEFMEKKPHSSYSLTKKGIMAFESYVNQLEKLIKK
ncbi:MAG: winged helix-turn-helix domain-containing protein [Ignavibacteriaceae bacterium]